MHKPHTTDELDLPTRELASSFPFRRVPERARIFCNRTLKLRDIRWVGFDMDYTLAIYDQEAMDELSIRSTLQKLVARGYPEFIKDLPPLTHFPVRGLIVDKEHGNVLKRDRYKYVCKAFHGLRQLSKEELRELYHSQKVRTATSRYYWVDTLYALSEVALYVAIIDGMERRDMPVNYVKLFDDIRSCIDEAHRDGTILNEVVSDLPRFLRRDPKLPQVLHKWRSAGKKLFLLTNSAFWYTDILMNYLIGDALPEYANWRALFDIVVTSSRKPAFFGDDKPFMLREGDVSTEIGVPNERGKVYEGGNLKALEEALGVQGDEVLYVGDHIYGDILRSKKDSAWRTAMIIQELESEIEAHRACVAEYETDTAIQTARNALEEELRHDQARLKELQKSYDEAARIGKPSVALEEERSAAKLRVDRIRERLLRLKAESDALELRLAARFHPYWGSLMKEETEQSLFGAQVEDYACVYTSRVSNFLNYSPQQKFRSRRDRMAHELEDESQFEGT